MRTASLPDRFRERLDALGVRGTGAHVLVALSGGGDSAALLHLLRFAADDPGMRVSAAHFDHALRPGSAADAEWVRGLCAAWAVPLVSARAKEPPRGEAGARRARYTFLREAQQACAASHLATAHHADDQAETVLFRVLRGTGTAGLAGIAEAGPGGLVRPLLPFARAELRRYARRHRLRWRADPTNRSLHPARNRIRLHLLPQAERHVARGARRNLVRLSELAREDEAALNALAAAAIDETVRAEEGAFVLVRGRFSGYDTAIAARALRMLLRRMGTVPDRAGTRLALEFISNAPSGRRLELRGARLVTEFGTVRIEPAGAERHRPPDEPATVPGPAGGAEACRIGGRRYTVRWCPGAAGAAENDGRSAAMAADRLRFPLTVRGRRGGDRIRTRAGSRTLKRLLMDARVPRGARSTVPVVVDADGAVLWVPGIATSPDAVPRPGERAITLTIAE